MSTIEYLLDPSSSLITHIVSNGKMRLGTISNFNANTATYLDISGVYSSNSVSAIQIPADTTANRPLNPAKGSIRYNTDAAANYIEYWNGSTWLAISYI